MAPVALLHPTAFHVEPKGATASRTEPACSAADSGRNAAAAAVVQVPDGWAPAAAAAQRATAAAGPSSPELDVQLGIVDGQQYCSLTASVSLAGSASTAQLHTAEGTAAALAAALGRLSQALPALGLEWQSSLFVHLYVPSMAQFAAANAAYAAVLPAVNPPSRATVQLASCGGGGGGSDLALVVEVLFARCGAAACSPFSHGTWEQRAQPAVPRPRHCVQHHPCSWPKSGMAEPEQPSAPSTPAAARHRTGPPPQAAGRAARAACAEHQRVGALLHRAVQPGHASCGPGALRGAGAWLGRQAGGGSDLGACLPAGSEGRQAGHAHPCTTAPKQLAALEGRGRDCCSSGGPPQRALTAPSRQLHAADCAGPAHHGR